MMGLDGMCMRINLCHVMIETFCWVDKGMDWPLVHFLGVRRAWFNLGGRVGGALDGKTDLRGRRMGC